MTCPSIILNVYNAYKAWKYKPAHEILLLIKFAGSEESE